MKKLLLLGCLFVCFQSRGQSISQQVIGSAGYSSLTASNTSLSWTLGEVVTTTESSATTFLTQGFHQPIVINPLSTNQVGSAALSMQVYPNPTMQQITIYKQQDATLQVELLDILGQSIGNYTLKDAHTTIDLGHLPAANYLLHIRNKENSSIKTFKVQKIQ